VPTGVTVTAEKATFVSVIRNIDRRGIGGSTLERGE
jgi:hypothetical protein